jgi:hypothetical protein
MLTENARRRGQRLVADPCKVTRSVDNQEVTIEQRLQSGAGKRGKINYSSSLRDLPKVVPEISTEGFLPPLFFCVAPSEFFSRACAPQ